MMRFFPRRSASESQPVTARIPPGRNMIFPAGGFCWSRTNEFNREIGQEFLGMANAAVEHAENGREAVDRFTASAPGYYDMILMDVQMPVMNGHEATRAIRRIGAPDARDIPILAMTADAFSEDVAAAAAAGMNGHLAKPVNINDLYRLMDMHLKKRTRQV